MPRCIGINTYPATVFNGPPDMPSVKLSNIATIHTPLKISNIYFVGRTNLVFVSYFPLNQDLTFMLKARCLYLLSETIFTRPRTTHSSGSSQVLISIPVISANNLSRS